MRSNHDRHPKRGARTLNTTTTGPPAPPPPSDLLTHSAAATTQPLAPRIQSHPPTQPPSYKAPEFRKSQLHRQYTSLLQATPLMLLFQHNNLRASEWAGIRRELGLHLQRRTPQPLDPARKPRLVILNKDVFAAALRVMEHYRPRAEQQDSSVTQAHYLSRDAYRATLHPRGNAKGPRKKRTTLDPMLVGPVAALTFADLAPEQLASALCVLAPRAPAFAAPRRREAPGLYETSVQSGLEKLVLVGARIEGRAMDGEGVSWVGGLAERGGMEGLRAEVVGLLQGVGMGLVGGLEGMGRNVWATMESRRMDLEGEGKKGE